jgi:hypothetical protein
VDSVELMARIFDNPDNFGLREKVASVIQPGKYEYLMKACAVIVNGNLSYGGQIEHARLMTILRYISSKLTKDEVWFLAKHSKTGTIEEAEGEKYSMISF